MLEKYLAGLVIFLVAVAVLALIRAFWGGLRLWIVLSP